MAEEVPEININTEETAHVNRQRTQVRRQYEPTGLTEHQRARLAARRVAPTAPEAPHAQAAQEAVHAPADIPEGAELTPHQARVMAQRQAAQGGQEIQEPPPINRRTQADFMRDFRSDTFKLMYTGPDNIGG